MSQATWTIRYQLNLTQTPIDQQVINECIDSLNIIKAQLTLARDQMKAQLDTVKQENFPDGINAPYMVVAILEDDTILTHIRKIDETITQFGYLLQSCESGIF